MWHVERALSNYIIFLVELSRVHRKKHVIPLLKQHLSSLLSFPLNFPRDRDVYMLKSNSRFSSI